MTDRLDHALLAELRHLMEDDFGTLLEAYLRDSQQRFLELSEAWERRDLETLRRSAHSLKGASGNIGAAGLASLCGELEQLALTRCEAGVAEALTHVELELREVRDAVVALNGRH